MTVPTSPPLLAGVIGADADTLPLEATTPAGSGALSYQSGWPPLTALPLEAGGVAPQREYFNKVNQLLSQHLVYLQAGGIYPWSDALDYPVNAHVLGSDGREYRAIQQSGPGLTEGAQDPTSAGGAAYWMSLAAAMAHAAMPSGYWIDLPVPQPQGTVTVPGDGYLQIRATSTGAGAFVGIGGVGNACSTSIVGYGVYASIAVSAGSLNQISYNEVRDVGLRFVYCIGSAPQP